MTGEESVDSLLEEIIGTFERVSLVDRSSAEAFLYQHDAQVVEKVLRILQARSSVLRDRGDVDILDKAARDGSSVMCQRCHGLVPVQRFQVHQQLWCVGESQQNEMNLQKSNDCAQVQGDDDSANNMECD